MDWLIIGIIGVILMVSLIIAYILFFSSSQKEESLIQKIGDNILEEELKSVILVSAPKEK